MVAFVFSLTLVSAQNNDDQNNSDPVAPAGMEFRKVNNDVSVLIPKDGKMYKRNETTYVMEDSEEYSARKFVGIEKRVDKLEKFVSELADEVKALKAKIDTTEKGADKNDPAIAEE